MVESPNQLFWFSVCFFLLGFFLVNGKFSKKFSSNSQTQLDFKFNLRLQEKMLKKQSEREERNANKERNIAKRHLAKGDNSKAKIHATNSIRSNQHAHFLLENSVRISQMAMAVQSSEVESKVAQSLNNSCNEMNKYISSMDVDKISGMISKYEELSGIASKTHHAWHSEKDVDLCASCLIEDLKQEIIAENAVNMEKLPTKSNTKNNPQNHSEIYK